jgi:hypothetical protein
MVAERATSGNHPPPRAFVAPAQERKAPPPARNEGETGVLFRRLFRGREEGFLFGRGMIPSPALPYFPPCFSSHFATSGSSTAPVTVVTPPPGATNAVNGNSPRQPLSASE